MLKNGLIMVFVGILAELPLIIFRGDELIYVVSVLLVVIGSLLNVYGLTLVERSRNVNPAWAILSIFCIPGAAIGAIILLDMCAPGNPEPEPPGPEVYYCKRCGRPLPKSRICEFCDGAG